LRKRTEKIKLLQDFFDFSEEEDRVLKPTRSRLTDSNFKNSLVLSALSKKFTSKH